MSDHWREAPDADFAVLGDPVGHSLSPLIHRAAYEAVGLECRYLALRVPAPELDLALEHLAAWGFRGVNLTVPHKIRAFRLAEHVCEEAKLYGAVNVMKLPSREAMNTDGEAFLRTLRDQGIFPPATLLIVGSGGAARTIAIASAIRGYKVRITARSLDRARDIASLHANIQPVDPEVDAEDVVVNATSAGLLGSRPKLAWPQRSHPLLAYDLSYGPAAKPFLQHAAKRARSVCDGLEMLVEQAAFSFEWWLDLPAPREAMRKAARCALR